MLNHDPTDGWDNVDYIGKVFGTGHNQKHNVTLEGGSDDIHYFLSGGFMSQQATSPTSTTVVTTSVPTSTRRWDATGS